jgi:hypothetical protein
MGELVTLYRQSQLGGRLPAYDGRKSLYTAGPLPFTFRTFEITLQDEEESLSGGQGGPRYDIASVCIWAYAKQTFVLTSAIPSDSGVREYLGW